MSSLTSDLKKLFNYKYKKRDDNLTDQYSRMFMTKAMLVAATITGLSWYSDEIKCLVPGLAGKAIKGFSGKSCWINGFYIYDELRKADHCHGYFGIPTNSEHNGTLTNGACTTCVVQSDNRDCKPMNKLFYIQYQWYPFFLAALAMLYYAPYFLFHVANDDLKALKVEIKKINPDIETIVKTYFDPDDEVSAKRQKRNIILNIVMRFAYFLANVIVLVLCNGTLNGDYISFGRRWLQWADHDHRNNYVDKRSFLEAGEMLLPTFGFCDVLEEGLDIKNTIINEHKFVCEISQHVLYQYVLMALWFLIVIGIFLSLYGFISHILTYALWKVSLGGGKDQEKSKVVHKYITVRQGEYLLFIRKKNLMFYGQILENLYQKFRVDPKKICGNPGVAEDVL